MKLFFHKLTHWEYWPYHVVYLPVYFQYIYYILKTRSFFYFSASNPTIKNGGFFMESKMEIYDLIPKKYYPTTLFIKQNEVLDTVLDKILKTQISFPCIAKPDAGLRGTAVQKLEQISDLKKYIEKANFDYLIQNLIPYKNEIGLFYVRYPNQKKGTITGIVKKEFLSVTGDGKSTIKELILKNKERLLSQKEPVRFIFSHSALREGWDNPNVFVICMLKHSDSEISRRQEVGRGLRLAVNEFGERMDHPAMVHDINVLTVISSESYKEFVDGLQKEISGSLANRPRQANEAFFKGKLLITDSGTVEVGQDLAAGIEFYLVQQGYVDRNKHITETYHQAKLDRTLAELPADLREFTPQVFELIDSVFCEAALPRPEDSRRSKTNPLNSNFDKKEFRDLWSRINKKAVYKVAFDSSELIEKCVSSLDCELHVTPLQYTVKIGKQAHELTSEVLKRGEGFELDGSHTAQGQPIETHISYDLLGKITENVGLTRGTVAEILSRIQPSVFQQYANNPEQFISECGRIIKEQKATVIIEQLTYDAINDCYDATIFTTAQTGNDFSRATEILKKHIFDYAMIDSDIERQFVSELDISNEVVVYAKLPRGFLIPTPVGDYNPDWAIAFVEGKYKHIYFVAETKGTLSSMKLRPEEKTKIDCARKFFKAIDKDTPPNNVRYEMVDSYSALVSLIAAR